jgi:hypothetical protein
MFTTPIILLACFACYLVGAVSTLLLSQKNLTIAQHVGLLFLAFYMFLIAASKIEGFEVELTIHAGGLTSLCTLLGIKTSEMVLGFLPRR